MVDWTSMTSGASVEAIIAAVAALIVAFLFFALILYVYNGLVWMTIGKKLRYKYPWLAWIPIANGSMVLQMGGFHWAWIFLILVPVLGWIALGVLGIIACWRIFEKRNYPGWLALVPLAGFINILGSVAGIVFLVVLGFVAWKDMKKKR